MWPKPSHNSPDSEKGEAAETLLHEDTQHRERREQSRQGYPIRKYAILVISHCLLAFIGVLLGSHWRLDASTSAAQVTARYSPFTKDVGLKYHTVQFNGSFFNLNDFRLDAGLRVDAAWKSLGVDYRSVRVPEDQAARSGLAHDQVKINPKYGGGFPANVEGLHHLHCLNLLRQSLYYNFDYYHALGEGAFKNDDNILKHHVTHCLDIVRQQLMCTVDVGMLGQVWWDKQAPKAFVGFNTKHICRNYENIRKWAEERQLPEKVPKDFLRPPENSDRIYDAVP